MAPSYLLTDIVVPQIQYGFRCENG
jgi:hypothetical protein